MGAAVAHPKGGEVKLWRKLAINKALSVPILKLLQSTLPS